MKRLPFSQSSFSGIFSSADGAQKYVDTHANWARKAGAIFAKRLQALGLSPGKVLDVGSGSGDMVAALAESFPGAEFVGLDLSEHMVEIARRRTEEADLAGRVEFKVGDATDMPFESRSFDVVLSQDTLHLLDDPLPMLDECARVLRPGGRLLLRSVRRSWLGLLDAIFKTGYTAAELIELARRSDLTEPRVQASLLYLMLEASGE